MSQLKQGKVDFKNILIPIVIVLIGLASVLVSEIANRLVVIIVNLISLKNLVAADIAPEVLLKIQTILDRTSAAKLLSNRLSIVLSVFSIVLAAIYCFDRNARKIAKISVFLLVVMCFILAFIWHAP